MTNAGMQIMLRGKLSDEDVLIDLKYLWKSGLLYIQSTWVRYPEKSSIFRGGNARGLEMGGTRVRVV